MDELKSEHIPFIQISVVMGPHPEYGASGMVPYVYGLAKDGYLFRSIDNGPWVLVPGLEIHEPIIEEEP